MFVPETEMESENGNDQWKMPDNFNVQITFYRMMLLGKDPFTLFRQKDQNSLKCNHHAIKYSNRAVTKCFAPVDF